LSDVSLSVTIYSGSSELAIISITELSVKAQKSKFFLSEEAYQN